MVKRGMRAGKKEEEQDGGRRWNRPATGVCWFVFIHLRPQTKKNQMARLFRRVRPDGSGWSPDGADWFGGPHSTVDESITLKAFCFNSLSR